MTRKTLFLFVLLIGCFTAFAQNDSPKSNSQTVSRTLLHFLYAGSRVIRFVILRVVFYCLTYRKTEIIDLFLLLPPLFFNVIFYHTYILRN